ncbi:MAG: hypothetical protein GEU80_00750 [Dehalococcoidia bacterium]|nr:hypothetical protein [Dehalococcoidia bacterium]
MISGLQALGIFTDARTPEEGTSASSFWIYIVGGVLAMWVLAFPPIELTVRAELAWANIVLGFGVSLTLLILAGVARGRALADLSGADRGVLIFTAAFVLLFYPATRAEMAQTAAESGLSITGIPLAAVTFQRAEGAVAREGGGEGVPVLVIGGHDQFIYVKDPAGRVWVEDLTEVSILSVNQSSAVATQPPQSTSKSQP